MNSEDDEVSWIDSQRILITEYLIKEHVDHLGVGEYPAFHVHPYFSLWAIQSKVAPGTIGWWAASGEIPTDYISATSDAKHPRDAMRKLAEQWKDISDHMLRGKPHPEIAMGSKDTWPELGPLLASRSQILLDWSDDDDIWTDY